MSYSARPVGLADAAKCGRIASICASVRMAVTFSLMPSPSNSPISLAADRPAVVGPGAGYVRGGFRPAARGGEQYVTRWKASLQ